MSIARLAEGVGCCDRELEASSSLTRSKVVVVEAGVDENLSLFLFLLCTGLNL